jgi:hypothetical protein
MNFRSSGLAACLLAAVTAGCGTVTAPSSGGGAHPTASPLPATASATAAPKPSQTASASNTGAQSGCQHLANDTTLTVASSGGTYCIRVGERFTVYLRGTLASRWLEPLASSNVIVGVPNGAMSLIAGLTGASFAGARPGQVFITSVRLPCPGAVVQKNEAEPAGPVPKTYRLTACAPQHRFSVVIIVLR